MAGKRAVNIKMIYEELRSGAIEQEKIDEERKKRRVQRFKDLLHVSWLNFYLCFFFKGVVAQLLVLSSSSFPLPGLLL